jgi:circadian clock protein KaiB
MQQQQQHVFRIFVNGRRPERSVRAMEVLVGLCREYLPERHRIIPVDINVSPEQLRQFDVAAVPTVIREYPTPIVRLVGDLSDREAVLKALGIAPIAEHQRIC